MRWTSLSSTLGCLALIGAVSTPTLAAAPGGDVVLQRHDADALGCNRAVADRFTSGRLVAGLERRAFDHGKVCGSSLVFLDAGGRVAREIRQGDTADPRESAIFRVNDEINQLVALGDDDVLVVVSEKDGGHTRTALTRLDRRGEAVYRIAPTQAPDFSTFRVTVAGDTLFLSGSFGRGTYQLPGGEAWRRRAWANQFVAGLDLETGAVRWAKTLRQTGEMAADGDGLLMAFVKLPGKGREARPSRLVVSRFDAAGEVASRFEATLPARSLVTDVSPGPDGGVAVLTETCELVKRDGRERCQDSAALRFFSADGAPLRTVEVPTRGRLARRDPGAPLRFVAPSDLVPLDVGRTWKPLHGTWLVVLTFPAGGGAPTSARLEAPGTWFEANPLGIDAHSTRDGVLVAVRSAVRDPRSATPSGVSSATTVLSRRLP